MATDVDVQYFSHLNGLVLGNNWGDLIRLLDKTLVTGIAFTEITAASIDEQGDVHITLYSAHKALLFQVVELSGFTPDSLNQKYRIKGTPSATELILKPSTAIAEKSVTTKGTGKLASLGYEIVFRDMGDVKRVYRAKNPRAEHPFIRVDETITDGTNSYTSTYAKSAMVGLLENMTHIDDHQDTSKLQLPLDTNDFSKNWKINGTGVNVVKGWMRWHYASTLQNETLAPSAGSRQFSIFGDDDAFYIQISYDSNNPTFSYIYGSGLFNNCLPNNVVPNWFLMGYLSTSAANNSITSSARTNYTGGSALMSNSNASMFFTPKYNVSARISNNSTATPILINYDSGNNSLMSNSALPALEIPFYADGVLLGSLKHTMWVGKLLKPTVPTPTIYEKSMYLNIPLISASNSGGMTCYLGEIE